ALREIAAHAALELGRELGMSGPIALEARLPFGLRGLATRRRIPRGLDLVRDHERRVLPAERLARRRDLFRAERGAVRGGGALLVRRAPADRRLAADQRRALALGARRVDRGVDRFGIVPVDVLDDVPAVRAKARRRVVGEPALRRPVDRDAVVVPERDQLAEAERARERAGLVRHALHQAAVAGEYPRVVVDDLVAVAVELRGEHLLGDRHADRVREALAERTGRRLDADMEL